MRTTHYVLGSVLGPHPYPMMIRDFQSVIGREALAQFLKAAGGLPELVVACVGGGSNAAGLFSAFVPHADGGYLVARGDRIEKYRQGSWPPAEFSSSGRVGLLAVDSKFKKVTEIAWSGLDAPEMPNGNPILCRAGGCYVLLVDTIDTTQHKCYFYISTIEY